MQPYCNGTLVCPDVRLLQIYEYERRNKNETLRNMEPTDHLASTSLHTYSFDAMITLKMQQLSVFNVNSLAIFLNLV